MRRLNPDDPADRAQIALNAFSMSTIASGMALAGLIILAVLDPHWPVKAIAIAGAVVAGVAFAYFGLHLRFVLRHPEHASEFRFVMKQERAIRIDWRRAISAGAVWTVVYNLIWGFAWFAFMRDEWEIAMAAVHRPSPWVAEVWFVWVVMTVPIGVAVTAYAGDSVRRALVATMIVWLLFAFGMSIHGLQESLSMRVLAFDALVNFVALVAAALAAAWSSKGR